MELQQKLSPNEKISRFIRDNFLIKLEQIRIVDPCVGPGKLTSLYVVHDDNMEPTQIKNIKPPVISCCLCDKELGSGDFAAIVLKHIKEVHRELVNHGE